MTKRNAEDSIKVMQKACERVKQQTLLWFEEQAEFIREDPEDYAAVTESDFIDNFIVCGFDDI